MRLERVLTLGGDHAGRETAFADVADIAAGAGGEVYVLDAGDKSVRVFSSTGAPVRRFGREGAGPGEFNLPVSLRVDTQVAVSDLGQQRMTYFSLDGRHLRTQRDPTPNGLPLLRVVTLRNGQVVGVTPSVMGVSARGSGRTGSPYAAVIVAGAGGAVDTLLRPHAGSALFHPRDAQAPFGTFDTHAGRGGAHAVLGDSILAVADGYSGQVTWYRAERQGLTRLRTRQLDSRSRAVTSDDVRRMERQLYAQFAELPRGLVVEPPPRVSIATQALFASDGSLWIRNTAGRGIAHVWTVFDRAGSVTMRLSLPTGFDLLHVSGDRLYGVTRTANDAHVVQVYRMRPG
ncbi:MAG TPA: 6-bladed beta-propeller [Longimicrobium sp.]|nr:6-bladed beta-propeller [Longimicrobium sp.]